MVDDWGSALVRRLLTGQAVIGQISPGRFSQRNVILDRGPAAGNRKIGRFILTFALARSSPDAY